MKKCFRNVYFAITGSTDRVRIYRYTVRKIGPWGAFFSVERELVRRGINIAKAERLVNRANGGPLPKSIAYDATPSLEERIEDMLFEKLYGETA